MSQPPDKPTPQDTFGRVIGGLIDVLWIALWSLLYLVTRPLVWVLRWWERRRFDD